MKRFLAILAVLAISAGLCATEVSVRKIGTLPAGTAGAFIGHIGDKVYVIGGSNFLGEGPWAGGKKTYLDAVYAIGKDGSCENPSFRLPAGLGDGCCWSHGNGIYLFGGTDGTNPNQEVLLLTSESVSKVGTLPEGFIPAALAEYAGIAYIHGTIDGANAFFSFDGKAWKQLEGCPTIVLSQGSSLVCQNDGSAQSIFLLGGRGMTDGEYHIGTEVWKFDPRKETWSLEAEMPRLMYSSAVRHGSSHIILFGGDDGVEFMKRDSLAKAGSDELVDAFLSHPGFGKKVYAYHTITREFYDLPCESEYQFPAVSGAVGIGDRYIIPGGERSPGVRSTDILEVAVKDEVSFGWVNYLVIVIYLGVMLLIGFMFSKRSRKNTDQFFKGGSRIPWWAAGISIFATALSAITFLSIPAKAYATDWNMFMFNMAIPLVAPVVIAFYLPFFRKLKVASAYQYLEERFSRLVKLLASLFYCLFMFARVAIVLFLPSLALNAVTGMDVYLCILLMGIVTIIYCTEGGIEAVVWGDVIQGAILVGGALFALGYLIFGLDGGWNTFWTTAIENDKFHVFDFTFDLTGPVFWVVIVGGFVNQLLTYTSDQSVIQRYITTADSGAAKKSIWLNALLSIPIAFIFFGIGTALFVFFKQNPEVLSAGMTNTDSIFPHYIMSRFPAGIAGLLISAVFAAAMSTLSANINSASTVMTEDFLPLFRPGASDAVRMRFAKVSGVVIGVLGVTMAVILATFDISSLWDQFNFFLGLLTSGLGGFFMMGIFFRRIGPRAALTGFFASIAIIVAASRLSTVSFLLYGTIGLVSCCTIGYLSSFLYGKGR
ncbi:MAG: sodium/solute symporter [Bacteroidales bacterium]|nr:sodium/solute symporter [Bacteroidales bacterium]